MEFIFQAIQFLDQSRTLLLEKLFVLVNNISVDSQILVNFLYFFDLTVDALCFLFYRFVPLLLALKVLDFLVFES